MIRDGLSRLERQNFGLETHNSLYVRSAHINWSTNTLLDLGVALLILSREFARVIFET